MIFFPANTCGDCGHGECIDGVCECDEGWSGSNCMEQGTLLAGVGVGVLASVVVGAAAGAAVIGGGGYGTYRYLKGKKEMSNVSNNPTYDDNGRTGNNPFYA